MDVGEIVPDHSESVVDSCESSMAPRETTTGMSGGDSSRDDPQGADGKYFGGGPWTDSPGLEQHDVLHRDSSDGGWQIVITDVDYLRDAIKHSQLSRVVELRITSGYATVAEALASGKMSVLQKLELDDTGLTGDICEAICNALTSGNCPALTSIEFRRCNIISNGMEALRRGIESRNWVKLESLVLNATGIDDNGMATLVTAFQSGESSTLPNLKELSLYDNLCTAVGMQQLVETFKSGRLKSLERLNLGRNTLGDVGIQHLAEVVASRNLEKLTDLYLNRIGMTHTGMASLAIAIQSGESSKSGRLKSLQRLDLSHNRLGDVGIQHLAEVVASRNLEKLTQLCLDQIGMTHTGMASLAIAIQSGESSALPNLEALDLASNSFTAVGMQQLAETIISGRLKSLQWLNLSGNKLGDVGIHHIAEALISLNLQKLTLLRLDDTSMNDNSMATLVKALQHGDAIVLPNLKTLVILENDFTVVGLRHVAKALKSGRLNSLEALFLEGFDVSQETTDIIISAFIENRDLTLEVISTFDERQMRIRELNIRRKEILKGLVSSPVVRATSGKVYLCGNSEVGKTTLSRSLQRTFLQSMWTREKKPHEEERTRGIDVAQISSKGTKRIACWRCLQKSANPITLHLWDMAGQEEYHLVHHSFFADLDEAKATTFVVVCTSEDLDKSEEQLKYWLRFIASSCDTTTQSLRHVFVVLNNKIQNSRKEDQSVNGYAQRWQQVLQAEKEKFTGLLEVESHVFWIDVRARQSVLGLKKCLLEHSRNVLRTKKVPELCENLQKYLVQLTETRKQFPVLHWEDFMVTLEQEPSLLEWSEQIGAGIKYLNEVGVLIDVDKRSIEDGGISSRRLLVLDPNWICRTVIGNMLLSVNMVRKTEREDLFRDQVNKTTGAISIPKVKTFFHSLLGGWNDSQFDDLISILLWLGLCYEGRDGNMYIPSLIDKKAKLADAWQPSSLQGHDKDSWVMGFSVEREESDKTLAPMSLWHKFQVGLAQTETFNGKLGNFFTAGKTFVTFTVDQMHVLIEVDARENIPTFAEISIFVKPISTDRWDGDIRRQSQVDLAHDLLNILLQQWGTICPTVKYVCKVVWPWPASQSRPEDQQRIEGLEVTELKGLVQEKGFGTRLEYCSITCDQLLSTEHKKDLIKAVQSAVQRKKTILKKAMTEAVELGIYPPELTASQITLDAVGVPFQPTGVSTNGVSTEESERTAHQDEKARHNMSQTDQILQAIQALEKKVDSVVDKVDEVASHLHEIRTMLQEGFFKVLREQEKVFGKLQETQSFLIEEKHRTCPNLIYLGEEDSGRWAKWKQVLLSPVTKTVRLQFACEARHNSYEPHKVETQKGIQVSVLHPAFKKILPWLKVSLTIFLTAAKITTNVVVPGLGMILPDMAQLQQAASLLDAILFITGLTNDEMDKLTREGIGFDANDAHWNPRDIYGRSRAAITELIGKLEADDYEKKFGLRRVCLKYSDGSLHGVVWICTECLVKFMEANPRSDPRFALVTEM